MKIVFTTKWVLVGLLAGLVAACGGDVGSPSSPNTTSGNVTGNERNNSPTVSASQIAKGTVTGFGSLYVDGVKLEDAQAQSLTEQADGSFEAAVLKLGQRVEVNHDGKGRASRVQINANVIGQVSAVDTSALTLRVAQQVVVVNTDSAKGTLTQFGSSDNSYGSLSDVKVNDYVEVHGAPVYDKTSASYQITATRIEKVNAISSVRVNGTVSELGATSFKLNSLLVNYDATTVVLPRNKALANGVLVTVWSTAASVSTSADNSRAITARRIRVLNSEETDSAVSIQLGGVVSNYQASDKRFELAGVKVDASKATLTPSTAQIADAAYVQVSGTLGSDGVLSAQKINVRVANTSNELATIRLSGIVSSVVDDKSFVVRGVPVDAAQWIASLNGQANPCAGLSTTTYVDVIASAQTGTDVVLAKSMSCKKAKNAPPLAIAQVKGVAGSVDSTALTFTLTPAKGDAVKVRWDSNTGWLGVNAESVATKTVVVEGYFDGSTLVARMVLTQSAAPGDSYDPYDSHHVVPGLPGMPLPGTGVPPMFDDDGDHTNGQWRKYRQRRH